MNISINTILSQNRKVADFVCITAFQQLFCAQHCTPHQDPSVIPASLAFRLSLLRLTTLFTLRHNLNSSSPSRASLAQLRLQNQVRASQWCQNIAEGEEVFPEEVLRWYHNLDGRQDIDKEGQHGEDVVMTTDDAAEDLSHRQASPDGEEAGNGPQDGQDEESRTYGASNEEMREQPHFLDLIPFFVRLTHERSKDDADWRTTQTWLKLAADFVLQAVLEEYLDYGTGGVGPLLEAFAWGVEGMTDSDDHGDELVQGSLDAQDQAEASKQDSNAVFRLERDNAARKRQIQGTSAWAKMRTEHLMKIIPHRVQGREASTLSQPEVAHAERTRQHLETVRNRHPTQVFEKTMLSFLGDMAESQPQPLLSQLNEAQQLDTPGDNGQVHDAEIARLMVGLYGG